MTLPDVPLGTDSVLAASPLPPPLPPLADPPPPPALEPMGHYNPATPWNPWWGLGGVLLIGLIWMLFLVVTGAVGIALYPNAVETGANGVVKPRLDQLAVVYGFAVLMLASQILVAVVTMLFAKRAGGTLGGVLALRPPSSGPLAYSWAIPTFVVFGFGIGLLTQWLWPQSNQADTELMMSLAHSPASWLILLVAAVGAPLQEELIFRGFLFSALARSRWIELAGLPVVAAPLLAAVAGASKLGIAESAVAGIVSGLIVYAAGTALDRSSKLQPATWLSFVGTALFTSACWAAIHGYSGPGEITIFCLGLMMSFILWRTGSTRVTMMCHGTYNALAFVMAALATPGAT